MEKDGVFALGLFSLLLFESGTSEADGFAPAKKRMRQVREGASGQFLVDCKTEFMNYGVGFWGDDACADKFATIICKDFDKTILEVGGITARNLVEWCKSFADFEIVFHGVIFTDTNRSYNWEETSNAGNCGIVYGELGAFSKVVGGDLALVHSFCSGTFSAGAVASSVDVLGSSEKLVVHSDTFFGVFDAGVLEAEVCRGVFASSN